MSRANGATPPPLPPIVNEPLTPPAEVTMVLENVPTDKTEEWSLGELDEGPAVRGDEGDLKVETTDPSSAGPVVSEDDLMTLHETPTVPLPVPGPAADDLTVAGTDERLNGSLRVELIPASMEPIDDDLDILDAGLTETTEPSRVNEQRPAGASIPRPPLPLAAMPGAAAAKDSPENAKDLWAEPLASRPRRKRSKPWFEEVFDEDYLRTLPFMTAEQTLREVTFIREGLNAPPHGELLDVGCGYGRHAIELAQRGLKVTGIDLSLPLLIRAADESQRRSLAVNFIHADMRELAFENQFDGAYSVLTSFGYFDEETNLRVATGICRALKPGGRFLLDTVNRDYIVADLPTRVWWEGDGCLVLEEVDFNYQTSRVVTRRSVVFQDGRQFEHDISIRAYSLHELGKLMRQAGFRVVDVSGSLATKGNFFGASSRSILMLCEKPGA